MLIGCNLTVSGAVCRNRGGQKFDLWLNLKATMSTTFRVGTVLPSLVRFASTRTVANKSGKISVQLLKDFPLVGARGEVVRVKPAFMRNYLHVNNGACYLIEGQGPRIPIVKKVKQEVRKAPVEKTVPEPKAVESDQNSGAMSLDELSTLFNNMRKSRRGTAARETGEATFSASENIGFTAAELTQLVPRVHGIQVETFPYTKKQLSETIYNIAGLEVPESSIKWNGVTEISKAGEYEYTIDVPGETTNVKRILVVSASSS